MAKSKEWLDKVDKMLDDLASETDKVKQSQMYKNWLDCCAKFWHYSYGNQLLILWQMPEATRVAGYLKWQRMKRQVRKGERGISILAPGLKKIEADEEKKEIKVIQYFFPVSVFDISQTDGEPLPELDIRLSGNSYVEQFKRLVKFAESENIKVGLESLRYGQYGSSSNGSVMLSDTESVNTNLATLIHEVAHEFLHWNGERSTRQRMETEAESVSYVVLSYLGIECKAPVYLAGVGTDKKMLAASLDSIASAAKRIIIGIESQVEVKSEIA